MRFKIYLNRVISLINKIRSRKETDEGRRESVVIFTIDAIIILILIFYLVGKFVLND